MSLENIIYLDSASTTPISKEVLRSMLPYLTTEYGNPNSVHSLGISARKAIDKAREQVAAAINANPQNIIFTSGGSEANNMVLKSLPRDITYTYATEHTSSKRAVSSYGGQVYQIEGGKCLKNLIVKQNAKESKEPKGLVWYMYVNNETGQKNPIHKLGERCAQTSQLMFGTDCVQALGFEKLDVEEIQCDFMTLSSHKIHGPKGVGALYVREPDLLKPLISGGVNQEFGLRGGTENVAGIVGFGEACEIATKNREDNKARILHLRKLFLEHINGINYKINCSEESKILSIRFNDIDAETFVVAMSTMGVAVSAGSACRNKEVSVNESLLALGLNEQQARCTVRFSFMESLTDEEVKKAAAQCKQIIAGNM